MPTLSCEVPLVISIISLFSIIMQLKQLQTTLSSLEEGSERTQQAVDHLRELKKKTRIIWQGLSASVQQQGICESGDEDGSKMDI